MNSPLTGEGTLLVMAIQSRHRVSVKYPNGWEMVEEYNAVDGNLELRRWQGKNALGRPTGWLLELGSTEAAAADTEGGGGADLMPASSNPVFIPMDHRAAFEWRVRNLPYPIATYQLTVDDEKQELMLRTTNKKYFKRFEVPALRRHGIALDPTNIAMNHAHSCLVIRYKKPLKVLEWEAAHRARIQQQLKAQQAGGAGAAGDGAGDCKTQ
jgi:hypothetical protein